MTVEEIRGERDNYDTFPVGLRVLAVDDDPICLKLLETLLRKCQYHVTTTSQARVALKMLRDNKDRFDLVISDVHMPDMDGFKLLEQVGLEMDLPVIMLSANGDPKLVMKGVTHGACDYLVKPVRIEELQNIWQHVLRRKKPSSKNHTMSNDQVKASGEANGSPTSGNGDQNGKFSRKRKDEEDESEDNGNDSEDPGTQKKPRVVWSIELHRKFVGAVNQLGIEKAVPKRILDMMNVEGLTRENVASHLQKYRLYLKRISSAASQQANMAAALGIKDSFMRMGSLDGLGDYRSLGGAGRLANTALSPYTSGVMLGRLNSPANININLRNLTPPSLIQPNHSQNLKLHPVLSPSGQNPSLFQGIQSSLELDDSRMFSSFADPGPAIGGSSSNLLNGTPNNPLMIGGGFGNQSSSHNMAASFNTEPQNVNVIGSSNLLDPGTVELSKMQPPNSLLYTEPFHSQLPIRENNCSNGPYIQNNSIEFSSANVALGPLEDSNAHSMNMNQTTNQRWGENRQNFVHGSNNNFGSLNSHIPGNDIISPLNRSLDQNGGGIFNQKMDMFVNGKSGGGASTLMQQNGNEKLGIESRTRSNENFLMEQPKLQGGFVPQSYDSLDDLVSAMIKREQDVSTPNCDFGFDDYSFGPGV